MTGETRRILVTGAWGQIGTELVQELCGRGAAVVAVDVRAPAHPLPAGSCAFHQMDVTDPAQLEEVVGQYRIDTVFHLAAILSATGEQDPRRCWRVNMEGTLNVLELALKHRVARVVIPSSIAVWGPGVPREATPQDAPLKPTTMYGITKVCGELLGEYYFRRFGLDVRGLRYPGLISHAAPPGGGTTDYAVAIFYDAVDKGEYTCFVREDTVLPMMYMPDAIQAALQLAQADPARLTRRTDYNVGAMSFSAGELAACIKKYIPDFKVRYEPDYHQTIADSWPRSVDDSAARRDWDWKPRWDLDAMTRDMLTHLQERKAAGRLYPR